VKLVMTAALACLTLAPAAAQSVPPAAEYALLLTDLKNCYTPGYLSFFDSTLSRAMPTKPFVQVALTTATAEPFFLGIMGEGFFKVQTKSGTIGYTRNGTFHLNPMLHNLRNNAGDILADDIDFSGIDTLEDFAMAGRHVRVQSDGRVVFTKDSGEAKELGKISLYRWDPSDVDHYENELVVLKNGASPTKIGGDSPTRLVAGAHLLSAVQPLSVTLRLLFVIDELSDTEIQHKATKKLLLQDLLRELQEFALSLQRNIFDLQLARQTSGKKIDWDSYWELSWTEDHYLGSVIPFLEPDY
jgi:flagellar basal body rod protein FlgF